TNEPKPPSTISALGDQAERIMPVERGAADPKQKEGSSNTASLNAQVRVSDPGLLREIRDRLYELNFDPGPFDVPLGQAVQRSIREVEANNNLPQTGQPTEDLLRRLRDAGELKPWGSLVYAKGTNKWGMSWGHASRKHAVASARSSCGDSKRCSIELSFFG